MKLFLGAPGIVCPLGTSLHQVHEKIYAGKTGLRKVSNAFSLGFDAILGQMPHQEGSGKLERMIFQAMDSTVAGLTTDVLPSEDTLLILCTTKGDITRLENHDTEGAKLPILAQSIRKKYNLANPPLVVSMACISGLSGLIHAGRLIEKGVYTQVIIVGADLCSAFTLSGFQSFMALSDEECKPFDRNRKGINLGEAAVSLVMSSSATLFKDAPLGEYLGGALANDANHISGPSRDGEGLFRAIQKLRAKQAEIFPHIEQIQAHGTATAYNDEMEAQAFQRAGLSDVPVNSLKAYFGHTLGAAGLLESMVSLQAMKRGQIPASKGFSHTGTTIALPVIEQPLEKNISLCLKTASGFGGSNAAILLGRYDG